MSDDVFFDTFFPETFWPRMRERAYPTDPHSMFGDQETFRFMIERFRPLTIIEVGSWKGHSANFMADVTKEIGLHSRIVCVDTFLGSSEHWNIPSLREELYREQGRPTIFERFVGNTIARGNDDVIFPMTMDSSNAAAVIQAHGLKADMIFIDAAHDYDDVIADITKFAPCLAEGGVMFGDDYQFEPLAQAVHDYAAANRISVVVAGRKWIYFTAGMIRSLFPARYEIRVERAGWIHP